MDGILLPSGAVTPGVFEQNKIIDLKGNFKQEKKMRPSVKN
jgi:hypothetical protein